MPRFLLPILLIAFSLTAIAQPSDYIVLKKKNNRTLKTYFPGTFISAVTYTGFTLNGIIQQIKNDSVFILQQEVRQVPTQFGVPVLDTIEYTIRLHYEEIRAYSYAVARPGRTYRRRGGLVQNLMIIGGTGFIALELINTLYRKESLSEDDKLAAMAIAAGVAATGLLWKAIQNRTTGPKAKYKVIYVNMQNKRGF